MDVPYCSRATGIKNLKQTFSVFVTGLCERRERQALCLSISVFSSPVAPTSLLVSGLYLPRQGSQLKTTAWKNEEISVLLLHLYYTPK